MHQTERKNILSYYGLLVVAIVYLVYAVAYFLGGGPIDLFYNVFAGLIFVWLGIGVLVFLIKLIPKGSKYLKGKLGLFLAGSFMAVLAEGFAFFTGFALVAFGALFLPITLENPLILPFSFFLIVLWNRVWAWAMVKKEVLFKVLFVIAIIPVFLIQSQQYANFAFPLMLLFFSPLVFKILEIDVQKELEEKLNKLD